MKHLFLFATMCLTTTAQANDEHLNAVADSLRHVNLDEAVVTASPKEHTALRRQAIAATSIGGGDLDAFGVRNTRGLSTLAPSLYMPCYGSGVTGATYVRGVGSRSGTPAVGVYVDNQAYMDKSGYSFGFQDVERVDVLRGPQGTLYGRNTMGGLVRITTANPLTTHGTKLRFGLSSRNFGRYASGTTYVHPADNLALSFGLLYDGQDGFFKNTTLNEKADKQYTFGAKTRLAWQLSPAFRLGLNANYEYRDERANPYRVAEDTLTHIPVGSITQNRQSSYRRDMANIALDLEWRTRAFTLTSISAYQYIHDRTFLDMDFMAVDYFSTTQRQHIQTFSEELVAKGSVGKVWDWTIGGFYAYQRLKTNVPVSFYQEGIDAFLNANMRRAFAGAGSAMPAMTLRFTDPEMTFLGNASMPTLNAAIFHQSTLHITPRWAFTLGLRADYDHQKLDLVTTSAAPINYYFNYRNQFAKTMQATPDIVGNISDHSWKLLPKAALQFDLGNNLGNVYASVANGYRSGGYNIQTFSSLSQSLLQRQMMQGVLDFSTTSINALPMPDAVKERLIGTMTSSITSRMPAEPDVRTMRYNPETTWNYEVGAHLNLFRGRLQTDVAFFLMNTSDLQITRFVASGFGRETVNAGKSRSYGAEISMRGAFFGDRLFVMGSYGYAHATFTDYDEYVAGQSANVSRNGNRIPYTPQHTFALSADYRQPLGKGLFRTLFVGADLNGVGSIYWDTANTAKEDAYALLGARLGVELAGGVELSLYGRNLTDVDYSTFSFANLGRRLSQQGTPRYFGAELKLKF